MAQFVITEKQLDLIQSNLQFEKSLALAEDNWQRFNTEEKESIIECLNYIYPEKGKLLKESGWYNTLGDIVGIFDPTGVVDLVNGISYIYQGDNLFGFLSMVSAIPYVGDVVAKPVMGALKLGAPSAKALEGVLKLSKAGKTAEAATELSKLTAQGGIIGKFVNGFGKVATKLRGVIERVPMPLFKGMKKTILQWFDLFEKAAVSGRAARKSGQELASKMAPGKAGLRLGKEAQIKNLEELITQAKKSGVFTTYRTSKGPLSWKTVFRGMPQLIGRNASVRALMRQSKWWLGFLDYIGLGNYVGPDELIQELGQENFDKKMNEYQNTTNAQSNFESEYGGEEQGKKTSTPSEKSKSKTSASEDPFAKMLNKMFLGQVNPLPG